MYEYLIQECGIFPSDILLMGFSYGWNFAIKLSWTIEAWCCILVSIPDDFCILKEVGSLWFSSSINEEYTLLSSVRSPIFIIHGK